MRLLRIDTPELKARVAGWLAEERNYKWLDFGGGRQIVTAALLNVMLQRDSHFLRVYTDDDKRPIGVVALNDVDRHFRTATLWGASGEKSFRSRGYGTYATSRFISLAFRELGLHAINTWVVEHNPSRRLIERLNFRNVGRQRQCHYVDGLLCDRLLYDLLETEHREIARGERPARNRRSHRAERAVRASPSA